MPTPKTLPVPTPTVVTASETEATEPIKVIVYDDPVNLMDYVVLVFQRVFGFSKEKATHHMEEVHNEGRSIVWEGNYEKAEYYAQQLQQHQLSAVIE